MRLDFLPCHIGCASKLRAASEVQGASIKHQLTVELCQRRPLRHRHAFGLCRSRWHIRIFTIRQLHNDSELALLGIVKWHVIEVAAQTQADAARFTSAHGIAHIAAYIGWQSVGQIAVDLRDFGAADGGR